MARSRKRPKAVEKKKMAVSAKQTFNRLLEVELPLLVGSNPPQDCPQVRNEEDLISFGPVLPLFVRWEKIAVDGAVHHEVSINEFALDEFLNKHVNPTSPVYGGVRHQVHYYLLIQLFLLGYRRPTEGDTPGMNIEPAIIEIGAPPEAK